MRGARREQTGGRARSRRRIVGLGAVTLCVLAACAVQSFSAFASGSPSRPVDRDLSKYVLFAFDTLSFKSASANAPGRGIISGGDVGAGGIDTSASTRR